MTKRIACTFLLWLLCYPFVSAIANDGNKPGHGNYNPAIAVSGVITDTRTAEALGGVSVTIKGTTIGTTTDAEGKFSIQAPDKQSVLVITFTGYVTQEITVGEQTNVSISLDSRSSNLNEVVVVGYGKQKKGEVTSSVASVKQEDFVKGFARDAGQLIQGKVAGLAVVTASGDPNATTTIFLRGNSTLMSSTSPLVLIDGVPGNINTVAPEDIESVDVLKDGGAAAIYGTRGTNGVVLITTKKKGRNREPSLSYDGYASVQKIARKMEFLDAEDYRRLIDEGVFLPKEDYGTSTDWLDVISRDPISHTHHLSIEGGANQTSYVASLNVRQWEGFFKRSNNDQLIGRADIIHSMFDGKLKFNFNIIGRTRKYFSGPNYAYTYRQAIIRNPTDSVYNYLGKYKEDNNRYNYDNPLRPIEEVEGETRLTEMRYNGSVTLTPIRNLNIKLLLSSVKATGLSGYAESFDHKASEVNNRRGYASRGATGFREDLLEWTGDYTKNVGKHRFTGLAGYSWQSTTDESFSAFNSNFPTELYTYNRLQSGLSLTSIENDPVGISSGKINQKLIGFFGRLNWSYDDKYMAMVSLRHEGSSKFGANYKWGDFPAFSLGWRISKENFMQPIEWINDLKIRGSFGVTGTAPTDPYLSLISLNYSSSLFLYNGQWVQPISPNRNPNPDLRWEKKTEWDFGIDFVLFNSKLSGSLDVYERHTRDLLYNFPVPVPPNFQGSTLANAGQMKNRGFEMLLNYDFVRTKDLTIASNITYSYNDNTLVSINNEFYKLTTDNFMAGHTGEPIQVTTHQIKVGEPIGNFFGYKSIDIDEDGVWIIEGADGKPKSINDAKPEDRKILGNGIPKHVAGWNINARYKQFDFAVTMRGAFGYQILNFQRLYYENPTIKEYNMLKSAFDNVYGKRRLNYPLSYVSYYIENGDHWKIDNITLGYNIPIKNRKYFKSARVYVSGLNCITITKYKGIDPEVNRGSDAASDSRDKYPTMRTFTFGANFTL